MTLANNKTETNLLYFYSIYCLQNLKKSQSSKDLPLPFSSDKYGAITAIVETTFAFAGDIYKSCLSQNKHESRILIFLLFLSLKPLSDFSAAFLN